MENTEEMTKDTKENTEVEEELSEETVCEEKKKASEEQNVDEDFKEKYYYLAAEMENLRKRLEREKSQVIKFGNESILSDMIQVMDTFELTLKAIRNVDDKNVQNIVVGLDMVCKQFLDTLQRHGLKKIEAEGKIFDPNFHEATSIECIEGKKEMEIIEEQQSGYTLNDRVLRASKVVVSSNENKK